MSREARLMIRLDEGIKREFEETSAMIGVAPSTLASVLIGQYVVQQRDAIRARNELIEKGKEELSSQLRMPFTDEAFEALKKSAPGFIDVFEHMMGEVVKNSQS